MEKPKHRMSITLTPSLRKKMFEFSGRHTLSLSEFVRAALWNYIRQFEEKNDEAKKVSS